MRLFESIILSLKQLIDTIILQMTQLRKQICRLGINIQSKLFIRTKL